MADSASSSDDSGSKPEWVFYKDRPDWKDVQPVQQDDGPFPVVQIAYSDKCSCSYVYLSWFCSQTCVVFQNTSPDLVLG